MTWDDFYERFFDWADSTKVSKISSLTTLGEEEDIIEVAGEYAYIGNKECTRFLKKIIALGGCFTASNIMELIYNVEPSFIWELAQKNNTPYSEDALDELATYLSDEQLKSLARKSNIRFQTVSESQKRPETKRPGFFEAMAAIFTTGGSKQNTHGHRCNGDCANCPPHYGYRYGRWYYGHNHMEGCEFGGNSGSGGKD